MMLLNLSGGQRSSYLIPKNCYQIISLFIACDKFCALINEIHDLIGCSIKFNLSFVSVSLVDAAIPW